jgi:hypothetical protein
VATDRSTEKIALCTLTERTLFAHSALLVSVANRDTITGISLKIAHTPLETFRLLFFQ